MIDREQVMKVLATIEDPEINRPLLEMGMIRELEITDDTVSMTVVLTVQGCPLKSTIEEDAAEKLKAVPGVEHVRVQWGSMTDQEREALSEQLRGPRKTSPFVSGESRARVIGVASGKGGVGKSTVTVNLAVALGKLGYKVGVLDADMYGFSVSRMLGVFGHPMLLNENMILPMAAHGVRAISMGNLIDENQAVIWRGPMLGKMLEQFLGDVYWGDLDYLLLDLPPGTGDMALSVQQTLPRSEIILVTTPQAAAANVAQRVAGFAEKTGQKLIGVVENMAYFVCPRCGEETRIFGEGGGERLAQARVWNSLAACLWRLRCARAGMSAPRSWWLTPEPLRRRRLGSWPGGSLSWRRRSPQGRTTARDPAPASFPWACRRGLSVFERKMSVPPGLHGSGGTLVPLKRSLFEEDGKWSSRSWAPGARIAFG